MINKNVLLICPKFFNYNMEMISTLKKVGVNVDYFDERPSNTALVKVMLRINKRFMALKIKRYYNTILKAIQNNVYDYILIIKPESIPKTMIQELRKLNPNAKIIIKLWDSIANNSAAEEKLRLVDKAFSFDPRDCEKYNMNFRPLFYIEKYNDIANMKNELEFDLLFVGTVHSDRFRILKNMEESLRNQGYKVCYYMYIPSKIIYYVRKYVFREFRGSNIKDFKFKSIDQDEVVSLVSKSKVIIDIHHPNQIGLTMRTIEMLGANKKIITTNSNVKEYDFYNDNNVQVVDRDMKDIDMDFFESDYIPVPENIRQRYSIEAWLREILN